MRISRTSPVPLYFQVADDLRRRIGDGEWSAGAQLPSEHELRQRYGVARGTVRQALQSLRADGLISGGRGTLSTVRPERLEQSFASLVSFSQWARATGHVARADVIESGFATATGEEATMLSLVQGATVWRCTRVRRLDGEPVMLEQWVFLERLGRLLDDIDLTSASTYEHLERRGERFHHAQHTIDAVAASEQEAGRLEIAAGYPLLRVRRCGFAADGEPLEWSDDRYISDRVRFTIENSVANPAFGRHPAGAGTAGFGRP